MLCPCAAIGWQRPEQESFMREVMRGAPPPLPEPAPESELEMAPCGLRLQRVADSSFCSLCFDPLDLGIRLSDGELLCSVCSSATFDHAEQHEAEAVRPPVACLAQLDENGLLCREDLGEITGRALALLSTVSVGVALRVCACVASEHVRGKWATFHGYDVRRHLAMLRIGSAVVCMRMKSAEDPLMLRPAADEATRQHERMLSHMLGVASRHTLQAAVGTVRAAHTLCGSALLAEAEARLQQLRLEEEVQDEEGGARGGHERVSCAATERSVRPAPLLRPVRLPESGRPCVLSAPL